MKSPVFIPAVRQMESIIAQTDPLPFVPATWMNRNPLCGSPKDANKRRTLSRPSLTPRFWVPNSQSIAAVYAAFTSVFNSLRCRFEIVEQRNQGRAQLLAVHDQVDQSMLLEEFGGLESWWQILVRRFLNDSWSGEPYHAFRFGQDEIAQRSEAGHDSCGRRMGKN